jgi:TRAP-type transport system periplasmic protein
MEMRTPLLTVVLALFAGSTMAADFSDRTLRVSNVLSEDHSAGIGMKAMEKCLLDRSGGKLKLKAFWGGALGEDGQVMQSMRSGLMEMLTTATSSAVGLAPSMGLFDLPYLVSNEKEAYALLDGAVGNAMNAQLEKAGLTVLSYWENGWRQMTNSKGSITKWEDVQGKKMRTLPSPVHIAIYQAMGATALPMPFGELLAALETGAVDGADNTTISIEKLGMSKVQKYVSLTSHMYGPLPLMYSKVLFDKLSADERSALKDCANLGRDVQRQANQKMDRATVDSLRASGNIVNELSPAEFERMREKTRPVYAAFRDRIGKDIMELADKELARLRNK